MIRIRTDATADVNKDASSNVRVRVVAAPSSTVMFSRSRLISTRTSMYDYTLGTSQCHLSGSSHHLTLLLTAARVPDALPR
jgi:hypothetical protein